MRKTNRDKRRRRGLRLYSIVNLQGRDQVAQVGRAPHLSARVQFCAPPTPATGAFHAPRFDARNRRGNQLRSRLVFVNSPDSIALMRGNKVVTHAIDDAVSVFDSVSRLDKAKPRPPVAQDFE